MGRSSNDEMRVPRQDSQEGGTPSAFASLSTNVSQVTSAQPVIRMTSSSNTLRLMHKSPQKSPTNRQQLVQDLLAELHKEEKIREATSTMLAGIDIGIHSSSTSKHNNVIKQLNNSLKPDSNHKKKVRAQFDDAEDRIQKIKAQLMELGVIADEDDEISSGDDEVTNSSIMLGDEYYHLSEDEMRIAAIGSTSGPLTKGKGASASPFYQISGSSSSALDLTSIANSSKLDLNSYGRNPSMSAEVALRHTLNIIDSLTPSSVDALLAVERLQDLIAAVPKLKNELIKAAPWKAASNCIRPFLLDKDANSVSLGIKLVRLLSIDASSVAYFRESLLLDFFLVQILARDDQNRANHELRAAVIELIRSFTGIAGAMTSVSKGVRCALIAVAEQIRGGDGIRNICVETLAEMAIIDPECVLEVGGLGVLLAAITEPGDDKENDKKKLSKDDTESSKSSTIPSTGGISSSNIDGAEGASTTKGIHTVSGSASLKTPAPGVTTSSAADAGALSEIITGNHKTASFAVAMTMILVGAADRSDIRSKFFRRGKDLSSILTPFTDVDLYSSCKSGKDFMTQSSTAMQVCLRSWVGVICFDLNLFVQCMTLPSKEIQETLLNVLDGVLWLPKSPLDHTSPNMTSANNSERLLNQFTAILLHRLQLLGLQERLVRLQGDGLTERICRKAQQIGAKIFALSAKLIPSHAVVKQSMALPKELEETLAKAPPYSLPTASIALFGTEAELPSISTWRTAPSLQTFIRFGVTIDDFTFKKLVASTHVLETKMFKQWNWDALMELAQGPLRSPKRLDELTRGSKFLKRLFAFYRPFKYRFSNLTITKEHLKYVDVGKELLKSLLETNEGIRYLAQNKLFRQIAECLAQLDPLSGIVSNEPLLSVRRFKSTLCCAYAELIGVLSHSTIGQQILAQIRIFNMFYRVCDINREDVIRSIICALDYRLEGHPRLILAKALKSHSRSVRLYATEFVGYRMATEESHQWAIDLMVEQLYDVDSGVSYAAAYSLHNMCAASGQALDYTISLKPFLGHLQEASEPLRILFMSRPTGFDILLAEFEHRDMSHWAPGFNESYVDKIETYLEYVNTKMINSQFEQHTSKEYEYFAFPQYSRPSSKRMFQEQGGAKVSPPAHFYGELALTDQGCRFLQSKGGLEEIKATLAQAAKKLNTNWSADKLRRIKGALWAVGHVASREKGGALFEMPDVKNICEICRSAAVLSLRGTAYYVLGLFALSSSGAELLHQCKWDVVYDRYGQPVGVVLPPESYYVHNEVSISLGATSGVFADNDIKEENEADSTTGNQIKVVKVPATVSLSPTNRRSRSTSVTTTNQEFCANDKSEQELSDDDNELFADAEEYVSLPHRTHPKVLSHSFDFELVNKNTDPVQDTAIEELLSAIGQLCSSVQASNAAKTLVSMRASQSHIFQNGDALRAVFDLMSTGRYKQVIRRFILGLFDMPTCMEKLYNCSKN